MNLPDLVRNSYLQFRPSPDKEFYITNDISLHTHIIWTSFGRY